MKPALAELLRGLGHEVSDVGAYVHDPADDYPDYAKALADLVSSGGADRGVLICRTTKWSSTGANRFMNKMASIIPSGYAGLTTRMSTVSTPISNP